MEECVFVFMDQLSYIVCETMSVFVSQVNSPMKGTSSVPLEIVNQFNPIYKTFFQYLHLCGHEGENTEISYV